mmetsp:Transcript_13318/g.56299  ORF Transcript_13318/g.56299 Transcript_13318/m.56299 type:complete len:241 (+) Transcript_13318:1173-1895(+)
MTYAPFCPTPFAASDIFRPASAASVPHRAADASVRSTSRSAALDRRSSAAASSAAAASALAFRDDRASRHGGSRIVPPSDPARPSTHTLAANAAAGSSSSTPPFREIPSSFDSSDVSESFWSVPESFWSRSGVVASKASTRFSTPIRSASAAHIRRRCVESASVSFSSAGRWIPGMCSASKPGPERARKARPPPSPSPTPTDLIENRSHLPRGPHAFWTASLAAAGASGKSPNLRYRGGF